MEPLPTAIVLVGGEGLRLRPLTDHLPKPMIPVAGRPLIGRLLDHLAGSGVVGRIRLASGYRAEAFRDLSGPPFQLDHEPSPQGTAGAVARTAGEEPGPLWVLNGDALVPLDLAGMLRVHRQTGAVATLAAVPMEDCGRYGRLEVEPGGRLRAFLEKSDQPGPGWINGGVYLLEPEVLRSIPEFRPCSLERHVFPALLARGAWLGTFPHRGYFRDLGTPESYRQAVFDLLEGIRLGPGVQVDPSAVLEPPLYLGPGCKVGPGARVLGPAALEDRVEIGAGATVQRALQWEDCRVGEGAVVREAILARGAVVSGVVPPGSVVAGRP